MINQNDIIDGCVFSFSHSHRHVHSRYITASYIQSSLPISSLMKRGFKFHAPILVLASICSC